MKYFPIFALVTFFALLPHRSLLALDPAVKPRDDNVRCDINNKIVVNGSEIFSVKQCILHPIQDTQIYNQILVLTNTSPLVISNEQYAQLPIGKPYTADDFAREFETVPENICSTYNQQIVSNDNISFYFIENCKKRKFLNYPDIETFQNTKNTGAITAISEFDLSLISRGRTMQVPRMTGLTEKTDLQILETLPSPAAMCSQVKAKAATPFVSYYASMFYLRDCVLHPVADITIQIMKQADDNGGIYELSTQEILALPQGNQWNKKN